MICDTGFTPHSYLAEITIHKGDDFMGRAFYPLRSIPNCGEEKTLMLHSHSGKTQHGYVTLQLSIGAKRKKTPLQVIKVKSLYTLQKKLKSQTR